MYNDFHDQINYSQILPSVLLVSILQQCSKEVISDTGLKSIQTLWETKQQLCKFNNNSFNSTIIHSNILDLRFIMYRYLNIFLVHNQISSQINTHNDSLLFIFLITKTKMTSFYYHSFIASYVRITTTSTRATNMHALTKKVIYINTYYTFILKHTCFMLAK